MLSDQQTIEMVYELVGRANQAMVNFLNEAAHEIHARAQVEVPKADVHEVRPNEPTYPPEPLYKRSHVLQAIPEHLAAYVGS